MVKFKTLNKPRTVKADKWRIMAFHKSGKIIYGNLTFKSEAAAHKHWDKIKGLNMVKNYVWYTPLPC